jgi:hypothetical protein
VACNDISNKNNIPVLGYGKQPCTCYARDISLINNNLITGSLVEKKIKLPVPHCLSRVKKLHAVFEKHNINIK